MSDSKKNEVALSILPRTWWLVMATGVGRAVLGAGVRASGGQGRPRGAGVRAFGGGGRRFHERVRDHLRGIAAARWRCLSYPGPSGWWRRRTSDGREQIVESRDL